MIRIQKHKTDCRALVKLKTKNKTTKKTPFNNTLFYKVSLNFKGKTFILFEINEESVSTSPSPKTQLKKKKKKALKKKKEES